MAIVLPVAGTKLFTGKHLEMHRIVACDTAAPDESIAIDSNGNATLKTITTTGGKIGKVTTVTDTYTILVTDETIVFNNTTAKSANLPVGVVGQWFDLVIDGNGSVTLDGNGSDTIDEELTQLLLKGDRLRVQCTAANKWVLK